MMFYMLMRIRIFRAYALVSLSLTLGQLLRLGIYFGIKALRALLAVRRARRGEKLHRKAA